MSVDSSVAIVNRLRTGRISAEAIFSKTSRLVYWPTKPPSKWVSVAKQTELAAGISSI